MREELLEFIVNCKKDTPLEEMKLVCRDMEELGFVLKYVFMLNDWTSEPLEEPNKKLAMRAYEEFKDFSIDDITTAAVQRRLKVGYPDACKVVEWLKKTL